MVLHHVTQGAGLGIVAGAVSGADVLRHGDLYVVDHGLGPNALEQDVTKAQGHQVLHRLFAQIVVDPVDLRFIEGLSHGGVDFLARRQVVPEQLLQGQAVLGTIEPDFGREADIGPNSEGRVAR